MIGRDLAKTAGWNRHNDLWLPGVRDMIFTPGGGAAPGCHCTAGCAAEITLTPTGYAELTCGSCITLNDVPIVLPLTSETIGPGEIMECQWSALFGSYASPGLPCGLYYIAAYYTAGSRWTALMQFSVYPAGAWIAYFELATTPYTFPQTLTFDTYTNSGLKKCDAATATVTLDLIP